jgi:methyltransferase (TIGR00027 family)
MAYGRELESARSDRLFDDPWARLFVDASGAARPPARRTDASAVNAAASWLVVRTRFIDDALLRSAADGLRQVVLLGAGLDTRAQRLSWPAGLTVFDVDVDSVLTFKESVLSTASVPTRDGMARRVPVTADVTARIGPRLRAAGVATAWVAEGLLLYLTPEQNERLIAEVSELSAPGSRLLLTLTPPGQHAQDEDAAKNGVGLHNPFRVSDGPADPVRWLTGHGWDAQMYHPGERAEAYGRAPAPQDSPALPPRRHLVDGYRRA